MRRESGGGGGGGGGESDDELSALLVVTVIIGLALMLSLLACYACVFKQLCCDAPDRRKKRSALGRRDPDGHRESIPLAEITIVSQPTETERV